MAAITFKPAHESGLLEDDLAAVVGPHIFGVSVGKTQSPEDVERVGSIITGLEKKAKLEVGRIMRETCPGNWNRRSSGS